MNNQQPIIIGVSGGTDSLALLDTLTNSNYPVVVAHYNHLLRPEASDDAYTVEDMAADYGVPFTLGFGSVPDYAREQGLSIEEAAREMRYQFLFDQASRYDAQAVAVGHNANDQVETVLMHLLRGAGLDGLTGMCFHSLPNPWSETTPLIRPLLSITRAEIVAYASKKGLSPLVDPTNTDTSFLRNRLRHELIPELESNFPGFQNRLWQTADLLTADRVVLEELTQKFWENTIGQMDDDFIHINKNSFNLLSLGLKRRIVRKAITHLRPGGRDVDFAIVQRALGFASNPTKTGQTDLGLGLRIAFEGDRLIISDWGIILPTGDWPQLKCSIIKPMCQGELRLPGEYRLGDGWILNAEIFSDAKTAKVDARNNNDPYRVWIDLGEREPIINIRPRKPGERFQPLGMMGKSMKISDFMINKKIPQRARVGWPLICSGDEIVWVPGYQIGHSFKITDRSQWIVLLTLHPE
ncbi:tRNA lysidine(34) synthetase TilS [Chloroflexota bacterium]